MLSKNNKILVGCLALLLVLSVGYALFSDTITINGTATAKGDFAYEITTMKGIDSSIKSSNMYAIKNDYGLTGSEINFGSEEGVEISSISNTANTITYSASMTNPGQSQYFTAKITNTGSIPIMLDIYYDFGQNASMTGNIIMKDGAPIYYDNPQNLLDCSNQIGLDSTDCATLNYLRDSLTALRDVFVTEKIYDKLNTDFENGIDSLPMIETGESIYIVFHSYWRNLSFSDDIMGLDVTATNTMTLPIKQYTAN